jgi:CRP-like cAMP-binding protein
MVQSIANTEAYQKLRTFYKGVLPYFEDADWQIMEQMLTTRWVKKGELICKPGQVCNQISFIASGLVRLYHIVDGRDKVLCFVNEDNYVSDYQSFLTRKPSHIAIQALEPTLLVETNYDNLQYLYSEVPKSNMIGRIIAERLYIEACEEKTSEVRDTIEERYLRAIQQQPWLNQKVPQYMIASMLGITPEAFSRIKARMNRPLVKAVAMR